MSRRLLAAALALGCAHPPPARKVDIEGPAVIVARLDLAGLWDGALEDQAAGRWGDSLEKLSRYLEFDDKPEGQMRAAVAEHHLDRVGDAAARLHALAERQDAPPQLRGEALLQEGVCRIELGDRARGEPLLQSSLDLFAALARQEPVDPALFAQAEYWLGEGYRGEFRARKLDPSRMDDRALSDALEDKARLLLAAQDRYLRCIRRGHGEWATAAGYHIGEMYEELHDQLVSAPLPPGLSEEQRASYRGQLRERVRSLVQKAIRVYEETLSVAERTGARGSYVEKTQAALQRMRRLLLGQD